MIEAGSYWKRKQVEPYPDATSETLLYLRIPVGTFVRVNSIGVPFCPPGVLDYGLIGPEKHADWDTTYVKTFRIYFERVTDEAELGLIQLAEQGEP